MDLTITKHDMRHFMDIIFPKGYRSSHTFDIYTDLIAVYEDNMEYTFESFLKSFINLDIDSKDFWKTKKTASYDELRGRVFGDYIYAGDKRVKYMDYVIPLFFISLVTKKQKNIRPCRDVAGRIFDNYNIFKPPKHGWETNYKEWYGENWRDWKYRWFLDSKKVPLHFTLSESEHAQSDWMYDIYERAKWEIKLLWSD